MAAPYNVFKTVTSQLTANNAIVYTAPNGYTTVALLAQVSNVTNHTVGVTAYHVRGGNSTAIISNVQIPQNDAVNLLTGKLILQSSDSISVYANENNGAQLLISILETAN